MRREWIEIPFDRRKNSWRTSPSMRREWIEIDKPTIVGYYNVVSLHAEGVD